MRLILTEVAQSLNHQDFWLSGVPYTQYSQEMFWWSALKKTLASKK